jgi:predicted small lipoprotein YifL
LSQIHQKAITIHYDEGNVKYLIYNNIIMNTMKKLLVITAALIAVSCGNKQPLEQSESDSATVATDSIIQDEVVKDDSNIINEKAIGLIQEFYKEYVFGTQAVTDAVINKYCTEKLARKLKDDYDFDDGGYAIWDFRSEAGDGDSDVQELTDVEPLGDGKYKVFYNDMGNKGSLILTIVLKDDNILFDGIEKN